MAAAVFAAGSVWHWSHVQRYTRTSETIGAEFLLVAGVSIFVLSLLNRFSAAIPKLGVRNWLFEAPASAALAASIWLLGMRQFGGYDHSAMIEAGWLQLSPLVPFKDYPCTFPPLFFLGDKYALLLFGVRWSAFVLLMAVFAVLSFLFLTRQFRTLGFPAVGATGLALTTELGTAVVCSYWWHNPVTSIVAVMVFSSSLVCLAHAADWRNWVLLGVASTLLVLSKPNAWPIAGCVCLLYATRDTKLRTRALAAVIASVAISAVLCWLNGLNPAGVLRTYSAIAETRGDPLSMIGLRDLAPAERGIMLWSIAAIVLLFLAIVVEARGELLRYWREYACCAVTGGTSLAMASMNYELKTSDLMPLVLALAVAAFRPWSKRRLDGVGRVATAVVIVFFLTLSAYWSVTRERVRGIGERMFFEQVPTQEIPTGFFAGLHSGPRLIAVLGQVEQALHKYPSKKVFFGPRMEFSYAAFHRDPPAGLPIWWHPGSSYPVRDFWAISRNFENSDFDVLIFLKDDYTRMPFSAVLNKLRSYDRITEFSELDVYVQRKEL